MVDIGTPLMAVLLSVSMRAGEFPLGRSRRIVGGLLLLGGVALLALSVATLTGLTLRAAVPAIVPKLLLGASVAMIAAKIALVIRGDARKLRAKKAARQVQ